jgi:hypothetical protein
MTERGIMPLKLTPSLRELLARVERQSGTLLLLQVLASGGRANSRVATLRKAGLIAITDHPTVKHHSYPADALTITDAGRAALIDERPAPIEADPT